MSAPKGNLFALGNTGGQPPKFKDAKEMSDKIAAYIDYEDSLKRPDTYSKMGKGVYTLSGLALFLGFASRQSMYDYEKRNQEFSYTVNRFKLFLTHWNEQKLYWGGTMPGAKLWLTNFGGYSEEVTQNQNVQVTELKINQAKGTPKLEDKE